MIVTDNMLIYDTDERFYYPTVAFVSEYIGFDEFLEVEKELEKKLKKMGRALKEQMITSGYNGLPLRSRTIDIVEYLTAQDTNGEREAIKRSLANMIEYDNDTDWFRDVYAGAKWPDFILKPVYNVGLYTTGKPCFIVPEDEYRVDY
jgi:hypothetical protein